MPFIAGIAVLLFSQNLKETHGKTNAQILAMGRSRWNDFYTAKEGGPSTMTMAGADSTYGDALAWRNDRLGKAKTEPLRKLLHATERDAIEVGTAISGGGTMWNSISASLYADAEETLYDVLAKAGKAPKRVVSDVEKSYAKLRTNLLKSDSPADMLKQGRESLPLLRKDLNAVIAAATRRSRRESDALLDFCIRAMSAGIESG